MVEKDGQVDLAEGGTSRRAVLAGGGAVCLAVLLAACGGDDDPPGNAQTAPADPTDEATEPTDEPTEDPGGADVLAKVSEVPAGGGKLVGTVLLVKLANNTIKAYDAHCTHQGFLVDPPQNGGDIVCANHGSRFSSQDGAVTGQPATRPLGTVAIKVEGDNIVRV